MPHIYSCAAGQWVPVAGQRTAGIAAVTARPRHRPRRCCGRRRDVTAFSGRTGAFVPLTGSGMTRTFDGHVVQGGPAARLRRARRPLAHDPRTSPNRSANDSSGFVAAAGTTAVGYGARASRLESITLPEPALQFQAALDGGGHRAHAEPRVRVQRSAGPLLVPRLPSPGGGVWPRLDVAPSSAPAERSRRRLRHRAPACRGRWRCRRSGALWFDPQQSAIQLLQVSAPGEERVEIVLPLPDLQALRGTEWGVATDDAAVRRLAVVVGSGDPDVALSGTRSHPAFGTGERPSAQDTDHAVPAPRRATLPVRRRPPPAEIHMLTTTLFVPLLLAAPQGPQFEAPRPHACGRFPRSRSKPPAMPPRAGRTPTATASPTWSSVSSTTARSRSTRTSAAASSPRAPGCRPRVRMPKSPGVW